MWTAEGRHRLYNDPESGAIMGSPKAWNRLKLNEKKGRGGIEKIFRAMKDCQRKSEIGRRITKRKKGEMSCDSLKVKGWKQRPFI